MDDNLLRIFIAVTTFAIVVQAGILVGLIPCGAQEHGEDGSSSH